MILGMMDFLNRAKPLTEAEKQVITIIRRKVIDMGWAVLSNMRKETATLLLSELDVDPTCPVKYKTASVEGKKPPKGKHWLSLTVWTTQLSDALERQETLKAIFPKGFKEDPKARATALPILKEYFNAVYGLWPNYWETDPKDQRLYHNIGIWCLLQLFDHVVSSPPAILSSTKPGKILGDVGEPLSRRFQKKLKALTLLDWTAPGEPAKPDALPLGMTRVQRTRGIPERLLSKLSDFVREAERIQRDKDKAEYIFDVLDNLGTPIVYQKIGLDPEILDQLDKGIESGSYTKSYT